MYLVGIDPGLDGALAVIDAQEEIRHLIDMPTVRGLRGKRKVDVAALASVLREIHDDGCDAAVVENVHAMPGNGTVSMFGFGVSFGVLLGALEATGFRVITVEPAAWKRKAGLIGTAKAAALDLARTHWPEADLRLKKNIGRADALLIARYGV